MPTPDNTRLLAEVDDLRHRLFTLANSLAGNARGNAAIYLHLAANETLRARKCVEAGNLPGQPIPARAMAQTLGATMDEDLALDAAAGVLESPPDNPMASDDDN
jgi:hypothetical protein